MTKDGWDALTTIAMLALIGFWIWIQNRRD